MKLRVATAVLVVAGIATAAGSAAPAAEVTIPAKLYLPKELVVITGTTVTWRNSDRSTHTVTEEEDAFDSGHIAPGAAFSTTFAKNGVFAYHCSIHKFMRGTVSVFDVVLKGPSEPLRAGRRAQLDGVAPAGAIEVSLVRVAPGSAEVIDRAKPGPDGTFAFHVRAPEPRRYRVRAGKASSPLVWVRVAPRVRVDRVRDAIAVHAVPARPGSRVLLQEYEPELFTFVTVARGRLDTTSRTTIEYAPRGPHHVRVIVRGKDGWSDGVSRAVLVRPRY